MNQKLGRPIDMSDPMVYSMFYFGKSTAMRAITKNKPYPSYHIEERVWIRQSWATSKKYDRVRPLDLPLNATIYVRAFWGIANIGDKDRGKWRQARHMPLAFHHHHITIRDIKKLRLHDITYDIVKSEGAEVLLSGPNRYQITTLLNKAPKGVREVIAREVYPVNEMTKAFAQFWDILNLRRGYSWRSNPEVYLYTFA